jgi:hypothetical protein
VYCGNPLIDVVTASQTTRALGSESDFDESVSKWGSDRLKKQMALILRVQDKDQKFMFKADDIDELILGRRDPDTGKIPQVDLSQSNAHEKGVSRQHALVKRQDATLYIMDNGSSNGTFLNGQKLFANQQRILRDGDDLRLGYLVLTVHFEEVDEEELTTL